MDKDKRNNEDPYLIQYQRKAKEDQTNNAKRYEGEHINKQRE